MSDNLFGEEIETPVIPEIFKSTTTIKPRLSMESSPKETPLFTHEPMQIPNPDLNVDLTGNSLQGNIEDILKAARSESD